MQVICDAAPKTPDPRVNFQINWKPISSRVQLIYSRSEQAGIFPLFSKHAPGIMFLDVEKGRRTMERYHCLICLLLRTVFQRHLSSPMVQTSYPDEFFVIFSLTFQMEIIKICTRQNSIMDLYIPNPQLYHYQLIADLIVFIYPFRAPFP